MTRGLIVVGLVLVRAMSTDTCCICVQPITHKNGKWVHLAERPGRPHPAHPRKPS